MVWGGGEEGVGPIWSGAKELTWQVASHPVWWWSYMSYLPVGSLKPSGGRRNSYTHTRLTFLYSCQCSGLSRSDIRIWIHTSGLPVPIRILIFSPMGFKMPTKNKVSFFSVADPWHFGTDPDPRIRTSDKRILIRILLLSSVTFKTAIFLIFFAYFFLKLHLHHFSKIKSHTEVTKQQESRFFLLFLLDDSRIRICASYYRLWIRIRNTDSCSHQY